MMMYGGGGGGFWHINLSQPQDRPRVTRDILARILSMLVPYWREGGIVLVCLAAAAAVGLAPPLMIRALIDDALPRSEEHTSELQSHSDLVCRLLLEKKKTKTQTTT